MLLEVEPQTFFIMARPPNQIEIITTIDGVGFDEAWANRVESTYGDVPIRYIGREELIGNKEAREDLKIEPTSRI